MFGWFNTPAARAFTKFFERVAAKTPDSVKADPALKLFVVGHTDTVGQFAHNVQLSQARAGAVVNALVAKHGIATARLIPFGCGPTVPVAVNTSEDGRAKNRRVELVAQ